jgi:glycosyltransferase involved in cell wall biosynthesis
MAEPVVLQALTRFDSVYASTAFQLAKRWAKTRPVLYVDHPFTWKDILIHRNRADVKRRLELWLSGQIAFNPFPELPDFTVVTPPPVLPFNFLPEGRFFRFFQRAANALVWKSIRKTLTDKRIGRFVWINYIDPVYRLVPEDVKPLLRIYHCVDNLAGETYVARHGVREERHLATDADLVVTTSPALNEKMQAFNPASVCIPNAADFSAFASGETECPDAYRTVSGPKLLYMGNIGLRIDYKLLEQTMRANPGWTLFMAGPVDEAHFHGHALKLLPNVVFTGAIPYPHLPAWVQHADVCLIPFEYTELTRYIYPLKINEYLAAGKPVVSTRFADLADFESVVSLTDGAREFQQAIKQELVNNTPEKQSQRKAVAAQNTWEKRVEQFDKAMEQAISRH